MEACHANKNEGRAEDKHQFKDRQQHGDQCEAQEEMWSARLQLKADALRIFIILSGSCLHR